MPSAGAIDFFPEYYIRDRVAAFLTGSNQKTRSGSNKKSLKKKNIELISSPYLYETPPVVRFDPRADMRAFEMQAPLAGRFNRGTTAVDRKLGIQQYCFWAHIYSEECHMN